MIRRCYRCGQDRPVDEFNKSTQRRDGLKVWCRSCCTGYQRSWRKQYSKDVLQQWRRLRREGNPLRTWAMIARTSAMARAKRRGLDCTITVEDIVAVAVAVLGMPLQ